MPRYRLIRETACTGNIRYSVEQYLPLVKEWVYVTNSLALTFKEATDKFDEICRLRGNARVVVIEEREVHDEA